MSENNTCTICLESIHKNNTVKTPCNHLIHNTCLTTWLLKHKSCPNCRYNFHANGFINQSSELDYETETDEDEEEEEIELNDIEIIIPEDSYGNTIIQHHNSLVEIIKDFKNNYLNPTLNNYNWLYDNDNGYFLKLNKKKYLIYLEIHDYFDPFTKKIYLVLNIQQINKRVNIFYNKIKQKHLYVSNYSKRYTIKC